MVDCVQHYEDSQTVQEFDSKACSLRRRGGFLNSTSGEFCEADPVSFVEVIVGAVVHRNKVREFFDRAYYGQILVVCIDELAKIASLCCLSGHY